jgi:hypothetical protein
MECLSSHLQPGQSLDEVEYVEIQHFPPRKDDIIYKGIFHSNRDDRMPAERSWSKVLKCAAEALGRHGLDEASATKFLMDKTMGANLIPFDNVCTWYSDKDTRPSYDAFAKEARPLMTDIFKDIVQACPNIKAVVIHGEEPYKVIVKIGGAIPLELIVNKTHNVAHGCRLSNNAYRSSEWIIYTDVVAKAVAILLDQEAIPLVTTEDRNEILLEPTWNSTEEKAAQKKNGRMERLMSKRRRRKLNAWRRQPRRQPSAIVNAQKRWRRRKLNARRRQPRRQPSAIVNAQKRSRRSKLGSKRRSRRSMLGSERRSRRCRHQRCEAST